MGYRKSGEYFYYIGFHANQPWLKSVCWVLIHNEVVNLMVKTVSGKELYTKIGEIRNGIYNQLKISQSTGRLLVEFNGKKFNYDDPELISTEPMHAFIGCNNGNNPTPAELRVDYMKVSGEAIPPRLAARKLSSAESAAIARDGKTIELNNAASSFSMHLDGGLHWGKIDHNGKPVSNPEVFVPVFAVLIDGQTVYSHELEFIGCKKNASGFNAVFKDKSSGIEIALKGDNTGKDGVKLQLSATNKSGKSRKVQLVFPLTASLIAPGQAENTRYSPTPMSL